MRLSGDLSINQSQISKRVLLVRALPGLSLSLTGWLTGVYSSYLRLSACIVLAGSVVLTVSYVSISSADRRDYVGTTALMLSVLMLESYLFAAAGLRAGTFNKYAPYAIISLIYLPVPIALFISGMLQGEYSIAYQTARVLLAVMFVLGVFVDSALVQLFFEVPSILIDHFQTSSLKYYYNGLIFGEIAVGSLALIAVSIRFLWLNLPATLRISQARS
jgi:hypothetical protein